MANPSTRAPTDHTKRSGWDCPAILTAVPPRPSPTVPPPSSQYSTGVPRRSCGVEGTRTLTPHCQFWDTSGYHRNYTATRAPLAVDWAPLAVDWAPQALGLAAALLGRPRLLLLDEPINGLGPAGVHWLRTALRAFALAGGTILVSSHVLTEVAQTVDRVLIINNGRLLADSPIDDFTDGRTLEEAYLQLTSEAAS
jgi:hypothetical protein